MEDPDRTASTLRNMDASYSIIEINEGTQGTTILASKVVEPLIQPDTTDARTHTHTHISSKKPRALEEVDPPTYIEGPVPTSQSVWRV